MPTYSSTASQTARQWGSQLLGLAEREQELGEALRYQVTFNQRENRLRPYRALLGFGARQKAAREERHAEADAGGGGIGSMIGGTVGAIGGGIVGGPPGAMMGAKMGAGAGQAVGNVVAPPSGGGGNRGVQQGMDRMFDSWGRMYEDETGPVGNNRHYYPPAGGGGGQGGGFGQGNPMAYLSG